MQINDPYAIEGIVMFTYWGLNLSFIRTESELSVESYEDSASRKLGSRPLWKYVPLYFTTRLCARMKGLRVNINEYILRYPDNTSFPVSYQFANGRLPPQNSMQNAVRRLLKIVRITEA